MNVQSIRSEFPILKSKFNKKDLVYLDNASTTQKPQAVINSVSNFYSQTNANIHRGIYHLSEEATRLYEEARSVVSDYIHAENAKQIIFTRNTTESINFLANGWARTNLNASDEILISVLEHHSNILPWMQLARELGCHVRTVPVDDNGYIDEKVFCTYLNKHTKIVSVTHVSHVLGTRQPLNNLIADAKNVGAKVFIDGAQAVSHSHVDVQTLGADAYSFSGHKMYGPTGIGVLWATDEILNKMSPLNPGGGTILDINEEGIEWNEIPLRFEGGTPNIVGAIGLAEAIRYIETIGRQEVGDYEREITAYALDELSKLNQVTLYGEHKISHTREGIISFYLKDIHPHDVASILNEDNIAVRAGHHCAKPLLKFLNAPSLVRVSFGIYTDKKDIDKLVNGLHKVTKVFK